MIFGYDEMRIGLMEEHNACKKNPQEINISTPEVTIRSPFWLARFFVICTLFRNARFCYFYFLFNDMSRFIKLKQ